MAGSQCDVALFGLQIEIRVFIGLMHSTQIPRLAGACCVSWIPQGLISLASHGFHADFHALGLWDSWQAHGFHADSMLLGGVGLLGLSWIPRGFQVWVAQAMCFPCFLADSTRIPRFGWCSLMDSTRIPRLGWLGLMVSTRIPRFRRLFMPSSLQSLMDT